MRGLVVCCFVITSLAFPSNQEIAKTYVFANKSLIHSDNPFTDNHLVYGVCEGSGYAKCKIYQESILDSTQAVKFCDLDLKDIINAFKTPKVNLQKVGKDYVVVFIASFYGDIKGKLITVNMSNCSFKETSIERDIDSFVNIIPKNDNYDIVFKNSKLCNDFYCKATYDYDGKIVNEAAAFDSVKVADSFFIKVNTAGRGFLVGERRDDGQINVYFVPGDDQHSKVLFSTPFNTRGDIVSLSTEENKLSFCTMFHRKVLCQQYDAEGKTKILQVEYPKIVGSLDIIDVLNLEQGLLVLSIEQPTRGDDQPSPSIIRYDEKGNQVNYLYAYLYCKGDRYSIPKLHKNPSGEYCVSSICRKYVFGDVLDSTFIRTTKCFPKSKFDKSIS